MFDHDGISQTEPRQPAAARLNLTTSAFLWALLPLLGIGAGEAQAADKQPTNIVYVESNAP